MAQQSACFIRNIRSCEKAENSISGGDGSEFDLFFFLNF